MPAGRSRRGTSVSAHTSAACQSLMDQQHDQHARGPPESTCLRSFSLLFALPLYLWFNFFLHEQQLSMRWHFNSTAKSPPTYLSQRTHQKLVQSFPLPLRPFLLPFLLFNNQGHGHNCRGRQRAKGGERVCKVQTEVICMFTPLKWTPGLNSEVCYWHLVNSSELPRLILTVRSAYFFPPSASCCVYRRSWLCQWTDWGGILCVCS